MAARFPADYEGRFLVTVSPGLQGLILQLALLEYTIFCWLRPLKHDNIYSYKRYIASTAPNVPFTTCAMRAKSSVSMVSVGWW